MSFFKKASEGRKKATTPPTYLSLAAENSKLGVAIWETEREDESGIKRRSLDVKLGDAAFARGNRGEYLVVKSTWSVERMPELVVALAKLADAFAEDPELGLEPALRSTLSRLAERLRTVVSSELNGANSPYGSAL